MSPSAGPAAPEPEGAPEQAVFARAQEGEPVAVDDHVVERAGRQGVELPLARRELDLTVPQQQAIGVVEPEGAVHELAHQGVLEREIGVRPLEAGRLGLPVRRRVLADAHAVDEPDRRQERGAAAEDEIPSGRPTDDAKPSR